MTNIKTARERCKKTQQECADALGITLRAWQGYEQGIREPRFDTLVKIADLFDTTTDYLLGRDTGEPPPLEALAKQFDMSLLEKKIVEGYLSLPEDMREDLMEFLERAVHEVSLTSWRAAESEDDHAPEIVELTQEERGRLARAADETQNPDNDL